MIDVKDQAHCCGCAACVSACPTGAIAMKADENGFSFPEIKTDACISCGACDRVCAFRREKKEQQNIRKAYAFQLSDAAALHGSTSGGAFTALSDVVLANGGVVCGAVMERDLTVRHRPARSAKERDAMRLSKYVQSDTTGVFAEIKRLLTEGTQVLFTGTPCQTAELTAYLERPYDNLIRCDFLCHGVPNQPFFSAHIAYLEEKYGKKAADYLFRGKRYGWNHGLEEIVFEDGTFKDGAEVQCYSRFFQSGASLRASCHHCIYRSLYRHSDVTIADFWGMEKVMGKSDSRGYSLLFVNSGTGERMVSLAAQSGACTELSLDQVLYRIALTPPKSLIPPATFWQVYRSEQYEGLVKRFAKLTAADKLKHTLKKKKLKQAYR